MWQRNLQSFTASSYAWLFEALPAFEVLGRISTKDSSEGAKSEQRPVSSKLGILKRKGARLPFGPSKLQTKLTEHPTQFFEHRISSGHSSLRYYCTLGLGSSLEKSWHLLTELWPFDAHVSNHYHSKARWAWG